LGKPVIGLTGPTGAGKSTVASALERLGCAIVDADRAARSITGRADCLARLKAVFGADIVRTDGGLNRQKLAARAFSSPENTKKLNAVTHPAIIAECERRLTRAKEKDCRAVILDAPLLFESGTQGLCDATVAVLAPDASRLKRIMARDGIGEAEARERMGAQHGGEYYRKRADYTFDGSTDWSVFDETVGALLDRILRETDEKA
jgi:dephospho-CoA kinase